MGKQIKTFNFIVHSTSYVHHRGGYTVVNSSPTEGAELTVKETTKGAGALRFHLPTGEMGMSFRGPLHGELRVLSGRAVGSSVASAVLHAAS